MCVVCFAFAGGRDRFAARPFLPRSWRGGLADQGSFQSDALKQKLQSSPAVEGEQKAGLAAAVG